MKVHYLCWLLVFTMCGCDSGAEMEKAREGKIASSALAPESDTASSNRVSEIACIPDTLAFGDTVLVQLKHPHDPYLAIRDPSGRSFFVAYPRLGDPTSPPAFVPEDEFARTEELHLPTESLRLSPWESEAINPVLVFGQPGAYEIILSENLESDMKGIREFSCTVYLRSGE